MRFRRLGADRVRPAARISLSLPICQPTVTKTAALIYVVAALMVKADALVMSGRKRPPETERERLERIDLIGRQIADAIKLDGEALRAEQAQRQDWRSR